jgi:hypothetical protein
MADERVDVDHLEVKHGSGLTQHCWAAMSLEIPGTVTTGSAPVSLCQMASDREESHP